MIIGITGPARSGKDTAAAVIANHLDKICGESSTWVTSFAKQIKAMLVQLGLRHSQLYGPTKDEIDPRFGKSPRYMLQTLGTEWGRMMVHQDVWVHAMEAYIDSLVGIEHIIIADVRFENEAALIRRRGVLIHIEGRGGIPGGHVSECGVKKEAGDYGIMNTGTLDEFKADVLGIF